MKKSVLALAVAAVVATPITASAAGHASDATVYASIRSQLVSNGGDLDLGDGGSRWGIKGAHDLGNGLAALYRMEYGFKGAVAGDAFKGRLGYVGLSGGFGAIVLGEQWTPYYSNVASSSDVFPSNGLPYSPTTARAGNALAYALPGGMPVSGAIALVIDGGSDAEDDIDAINVGATGSFGPMTIGFGMHSPAEGDDLTGLTIGADLGGVNVKLLVEDDGTSTPMALTAKMGGFAVQFSDDDGENNAITVGYTHKLGKKAKIQFSAQDNDAASDTKVVARLRVDF